MDGKDYKYMTKPVGSTDSYQEYITAEKDMIPAPAKSPENFSKIAKFKNGSETVSVNIIDKSIATKPKGLDNATEIDSEEAKRLIKSGKFHDDKWGQIVAVMDANDEDDDNFNWIFIDDMDELEETLSEIADEYAGGLYVVPDDTQGTALVGKKPALKKAPAKSSYELERERQLKEGLIDKDVEGISILGMMKGKNRPTAKKPKTPTKKTGKTPPTAEQKKILAFFPKGQKEAVWNMPDKAREESLNNLSVALKDIPKIAGQDGKGKDATVYLHYFNPNSDWYITELSKDGSEAFGYVVLNGDFRMAEFGYIDISSMLSMNMGLKNPQLDQYWSYKTVNEILGKKSPEKPSPEDKPLPEATTRKWIDIGFSHLSKFTPKAQKKAKEVMSKLIDLGYVKAHDFGRGKGKYTTTPAGDGLGNEKLAELYDSNTPAKKQSDEMESIEKSNVELAKLKKTSPIVVEWTEGEEGYNKVFKNLVDLQKAFKSYGYTDNPNTYIKNKVWFKGYPTHVRIDIGKSDGDYQPENSLVEWLFKYDDKFNWYQFHPANKKPAPKKYDLLFTNAGGFTVVSNRAQEKNGDYKKIAHLSDPIKYFEKNLPSEVIAKIEAMAKSEKKQAPAKTTELTPFYKSKFAKDHDSIKVSLHPFVEKAFDNGKIELFAYDPKDVSLTEIKSKRELSNNEGIAVVKKSSLKPKPSEPKKHWKIEFLNKDKNFKKDTIYFANLFRAKEWGKGNIPNWNEDMLTMVVPKKTTGKSKTTPSGKPLDTFTYKMLSRLKSDNDYFLGAGNGAEKHLWAKNIEDQISEMKKLWKKLPNDAKPEWLSMADIVNYEHDLKKMKKHTIEQKKASLKESGKVLVSTTIKNASKLTRSDYGKISSMKFPSNHKLNTLDVCDEEWRSEAKKVLDLISSPLKKDWKHYFKSTAGAKLIPIKDLKLSKSYSKNDKSVLNAKNFMKQAESGSMEKRSPVTVKEDSNGKLHLEDGNATTHALKFDGVDMVYALVEPAPKKKSTLAQKKASVKAKAPAKKKTSAKDKLTSLKNNPKFKALLKGVSPEEIKRDMNRLAKPRGRRVSKNGKVYYEYRRTKSDISKKHKI